MNSCMVRVEIADTVNWMHVCCTLLFFAIVYVISVVVFYLYFCIFRSPICYQGFSHSIDCGELVMTFI